MYAERMATTLRTPLCDLLGIDHPILQSGMGRIAGPDLVAEVSRAGGLGILAGLHVPPEDLRKAIAEVRSATDRPFGVNLWLHEAMQPPADPATIPTTTVAAVQAVLNRFRERLGLATRSGPPAPLPDLIDGQFEVILEERVPLFSIGLGNPGPERIARCKERGIRVMAMACTLEDARMLERSGVDVIVAQGSDAGGHRSTWVKRSSPQSASIGTLSLVPEIVDAVSVPVVAAGGIADGRGIVAAMVLGAQGVLLGTRFVATLESMAAPFFKELLVNAGADATRITDVFTGLYGRAIRNRFMEEYEASGAPVLPPLLQSAAAFDVYAASASRGSSEEFPMFAGQSMGIIRDVPRAGDLVRDLVRDAERVLRGLPR